jgi:hypothetical protein
VNDNKMSKEGAKGTTKEGVGIEEESDEEVPLNEVITLRPTGDLAKLI